MKTISTIEARIAAHNATVAKLQAELEAAKKAQEMRWSFRQAAVQPFQTSQVEAVIRNILVKKTDYMPMALLQHMVRETLNVGERDFSATNRMVAAIVETNIMAGMIFAKRGPGGGLMLNRLLSEPSPAASKKRAKAAAR